ncbi:MAG: TonB family protein [Kordiimonadaceae bacterium]|nr:TonB family protein [Kordiimonadaceae bacterium]
MITVKLWQIIVSFIIAQIVHVVIFVAASRGHEPRVLIEGSSISVHVDAGGAAMAASASGESRTKKKAHQTAVTEMAQLKEAVPPKTETKTKSEAVPQEDLLSAEEKISPDKLVKATPQKNSTPSPKKLQPEERKDKSFTSPLKHTTNEALPIKAAPQKNSNDITEKIVDDSDSHNDAKDNENKIAGAASSAASSIAGTTSTTQAQNSASTGNALSSNYAGIVMRHLSKFRRPRAPTSGSAHITFSCTVTGEISTIDIARSSGSYKFDQDAIKFIKYAAPFPPPPEKDTYTFTVEIKGR